MPFSLNQPPNIHLSWFLVVDLFYHHFNAWFNSSFGTWLLSVLDSHLLLPFWGILQCLLFSSLSLCFWDEANLRWYEARPHGLCAITQIHPKSLALKINNKKFVFVYLVGCITTFTKGHGTSHWMWGSPSKVDRWYYICCGHIVMLWWRNSKEQCFLEGKRKSFNGETLQMFDFVLCQKSISKNKTKHTHYFQIFHY